MASNHDVDIVISMLIISLCNNVFVTLKVSIITVPRTNLYIIDVYYLIYFICL